MSDYDGTTARASLRRGDHGSGVAEVAGLLARQGLLPPAAGAVERSYDAEVEFAVRAFQQQRGLTVDGVVGPSTYRRLHEASWTLGDRVLNHRPGRLLAGDDVFALQQRLLDLGFQIGRVDGFFGISTEGALREFQRNVGIEADGTCGPATLKALQRLGPRVSGGSPNALRAEERIRSAGPRLAGKTIVIDAMPLVAVPADHESFRAAERIVYDVARRIEGRLSAIGGQAFLSAAPGDPYDEAARAGFANRAGADLALSLTVDGSDNPDAAGLATYSFGSDAHHTRSSTGERLASLVHRELLARTDFVDLRTHHKTWDFLRRTRMPAVRADLGYLTNLDDARRLSRAGFRDTVADAVVVAVQRFYLAPEVDTDTGVLRYDDLRRVAGGAS